MSSKAGKEVSLRHAMTPSTTPSAPPTWVLSALLLALCSGAAHLYAEPGAGGEAAPSGDAAPVKEQPREPKEGPELSEAPLKYPSPKPEEVAAEPPLLEELLALNPLSVDQERCRKLRGRWRTLNQKLHGCLVKGSREGRWSLQEEGGPIQLLTYFKRDQLHGAYYEFFESGRASSQGSWLEGQKDGLWLSWHPGGQLRERTSYQAGVQVGSYFSWYDSCLPQEWGAFKEGERDGPWRSWYMTGARQQEGRYAAGKQVGLWRLYHSEGNKIEEGEMKEGLKEGRWKQWLHTGHFWREVEYIADERQGEDPSACRAAGGSWEVDHKERTERCVRQDVTIIAELRYRPSGSLARRMPYDDSGAHSGVDRRYHEGGELLSEGVYQRGVPEGPHRFFKVSGEPFATSVVAGGTGLWASYHANGAIEEVGRYAQGAKVGRWRVFHDHVQGRADSMISDPELALSLERPQGLKEELIFSDQGSLEGPYLSLYEDGTLSVQGSFEGGSRVGTWRFNYQNGQVAVEGDFQFGVRMGPWKEWHWMASPKMDGQFQFNRKDGQWREYHNNGKLKAEGAYQRGQREGPWKLYWYSGEPWRELIYHNGVAADKESERCSQLSGQWTEDLKGRSAGCRVCRVTAEGTPKLLKLGTWRWWHPNGKLQIEGEFEGGERHGEWRQFNDGERLILEGRYRRGQSVERWRGFYPSGSLKFVGAFTADESADPKEPAASESLEGHGGSSEAELKKGIEDGLWYTFSAQGHLESVGRYEQGARRGRWAWWDETGALSQVGRYQEGKRAGVWLSWHSGGGIRDLGRYESGERRGVWRWWREDGSPWRAQWYGQGKLRSRLPPPAPLGAEPSIKAIREAVTAQFSGLSAGQLPPESERRAPEWSGEPELPALGEELEAAMEALGLSKVEPRVEPF